MTNLDIQAKIDTSTSLLDEARIFFETSNYDESERCANEALFLLEPEVERHDLGEEGEKTSLKCAIIEVVAHAYNRLNTISQSRSDYSLALQQAETALKFCERNGNLTRKVGLIVNIGLVYDSLSDYPRALEYYTKALVINEELGNKQWLANSLCNIGNVYHSLEDYPRALEYYGKALVIDEELGNKWSAAGGIHNIGLVYAELLNYPLALEYFSKALAINEKVGNKHWIANNHSSIGSVYSLLSDYPRALEYYGKALAAFEKLGLKEEAAGAIGGIGSLYIEMDFEGYDAGKAEEYLLKAIAILEEIGTKPYNFHKSLADLYESQERWKEFAVHFKQYHDLEKEVQSEDAHKQAGLMEQRKQAAEREKEIELAKAAAAAKLTATTMLLHRVLPESIATRMIAGEEDIADYFPSVTILFADIAGFTPISAGMPAYVVVRFLNYVFGTFDAIMKKHGCEKIKTIGDGYMAVAGAPIECADHAERMALAALEMQEDIKLPEEFREYLPEGVDFGIRVGLHTGSVVGGVIGDERFVYDIYSDAVNTAARMESHGEPDKIHVSHDYVIHLQNRFAMTKNTTHGLTFEKRGEMDIKGKGMMKTYYLQKANI
ncbi:MAG: tetratricopeptide repeat protein [Bacteroidetes bacterium]|nr:tetratricopeptide repeat protein [Bacteroidota bacterium]